MDDSPNLDTRAIVRSLLLAATPDEVYKLISRPDQMTRWFAHRAEVRPFGFHVEWDESHGTVANDCHVITAVPGQKFAFRWESVYLGHDNTTVFELTAENGGCRLDFIETGFGYEREWDYAYTEQSKGWDDVLGRLARLVDTLSAVRDGGESGDHGS